MRFLTITAMIHWFSRFLYGSIPVRFVSPYSTAEAIARLSKVVKPSVLSSFSGQCAVGIVSQKKVRIQRAIPFVGNAWKPFFYGTFSTGTNGTVLEGAYRFSVFTRVFMSIWFGFVAFWTVLATVIVIRELPGDFWFPLFGVGMLAVGISMVRVGRWLSRNDVAWLNQVIVQELGTIGNQSSGESDLGRI